MWPMWKRKFRKPWSRFFIFEYRSASEPEVFNIRIYYWRACLFSFRGIPRKTFIRKISIHCLAKTYVVHILAVSMMPVGSYECFFLYEKFTNEWNEKSINNRYYRIIENKKEESISNQIGTFLFLVFQNYLWIVLVKEVADISSSILFDILFCTGNYFMAFFISFSILVT